MLLLAIRRPRRRLAVVFWVLLLGWRGGGGASAEAAESGSPPPSLDAGLSLCLSNNNSDLLFPAPSNHNGSSPSCCQSQVCGLSCPETVATPPLHFGIAVALAVTLYVAIGLLSAFWFLEGSAENFFVAGKSLPLWVVAMTLGAQSVDANSLLGNVELSFKHHFYNGAVLPLGLALSLFLNGAFLAAPINREPNCLTLPDVLAKRYGKLVEALVSLVSIGSYCILLAGNLAGMGYVAAYTWGVSLQAAVWTCAVLVWLYTASGGLFSVAYTDVLQGGLGWSGCLLCAYWLVSNYCHSSDSGDENQRRCAPPPSIGFPGYVYPNAEICALYQGVNCTFVPDACCYNAELHCTDPGNWTTCRGSIDHGRYPLGDQPVHHDQFTDPRALSPAPNALVWNWASLFVLGLGNLAALDFQVRCIAAKTPRTASLGCIIAGCFTLLVGIPFSYLGSITRYYYGPDSPRAEFEADSCLEITGSPTCGQWVPDQWAFIKLLTHETNPFLGAWCLVGIVAAFMSTADGAILAMGTVWSHNITRQLGEKYFPHLITPKTLLRAARWSTIPFALAAAIMAVQMQDTANLLILAFDLMLAAVVVPLVACFYVRNPSPRAALLSVVSGTLVRVVLELWLPKDGYFSLPFDFEEFYNFGPAASLKYPTYVDQPAEFLWDPTEEPCDQPPLSDYRGVDSLTAFACSLVVFAVVQLIENSRDGKPIFDFAGLKGYEKNLQCSEKEDETERTRPLSTNHSLDARSKLDGNAQVLNEDASVGESDVSVQTDVPVDQSRSAAETARKNAFQNDEEKCADSPQLSLERQHETQRTEVEPTDQNGSATESCVDASSFDEENSFVENPGEQRA